GQNVLSLNGGIMNVGGVGVTLTGCIDVDCSVSQGCIGFGSNLVVTKCRGNVLLELGGRRAIDVVRETVLELDGEQRSRLGQGLFVGRVINEYKERFGRDDYLLRGIRGFDEQAGAVLTDDFFRVGQTIRLHYRDTKTAQADLGMLLDRERLRPEPAAALLLTSQGREVGPAGSPGHDAGAVARAFGQRAPGVHAAKGGQEYGGDTNHQVPVAGFEAAGEIGPVGDGVFLHTQSAVLAMIRDGGRS
ncbi:MAG: FIST C-terminal domain-containing protein, partial [Planctomycetota bacterium]